MKNTKRSAHYVDNSKLLQVLTEYRKDCNKSKRNKLEKPAIPEFFGECIMKIAEHLSYKPNFINYSFREEMISDGIENCLMYFENFDPKRGKNPFAYFTQIVFYAFLRRIAKEQKETYVKYKMLAQSQYLREITTEDIELLSEDPSAKMLKGGVLYDNIESFIDAFEKKRQVKKTKSAPKKKRGVEHFTD
jgi:hypothetical protein